MKTLKSKICFVKGASSVSKKKISPLPFREEDTHLLLPSSLGADITLRMETVPKLPT